VGFLIVEPFSMPQQDTGCEPISGAAETLARETYEGYVVEVSEEGVLVRYDVGDDVVEQFYRKEQFLPGKIPAAGNRIAVRVEVTALPALKESPSGDEANEEPRTRTNFTTGNLRF
jgi:hypothetical protein